MLTPEARWRLSSVKAFGEGGFSRHCVFAPSARRPRSALQPSPPRRSSQVGGHASKMSRGLRATRLTRFSAAFTEGSMLAPLTDWPQDRHGSVLRVFPAVRRSSLRGRGDATVVRTRSVKAWTQGRSSTMLLSERRRTVGIVHNFDRTPTKALFCQGREEHLSRETPRPTYIRTTGVRKTQSAVAGLQFTRGTYTSFQTPKLLLSACQAVMGGQGSVPLHQQYRPWPRCFPKTYYLLLLEYVVAYDRPADLAAHVQQARTEIEDKSGGRFGHYGDNVVMPCEALLCFPPVTSCGYSSLAAWRHPALMEMPPLPPPPSPLSPGHSVPSRVRKHDTTSR